MNPREKTLLMGATLEDTLVALEKGVLEEPRLLFTEEQNQLDKYIIQLSEKELFATRTIVRTLLEDFHETGESKYYGRNWFCARFPWRRSRMSERLQELVNEGILLYYKRKYALNITTPFVQRIQRTVRLDYYDIDYEELVEEFTQEVLLEEGESKEKGTEEQEQTQQTEKRQELRKATRRETKQFIREIRTTYFDHLDLCNEFDLKEELASKIEKQILRIIGITENKI